jgi:hypothetical protein
LYSLPASETIKHAALLEMLMLITRERSIRRWLPLPAALPTIRFFGVSALALAGILLIANAGCGSSSTGDGSGASGRTAGNGGNDDNDNDIGNRDDFPGEVHLVAIYQGEGGVSNHETASASVTVDRPGEDLILILSAYEPTIWSVEVISGMISKVILAGFYSQRVLGLLPGTVVENRFLHSESGSITNPDYLMLDHDGTGAGHSCVLESLASEIGITKYSSFNGKYTASGSFSVDSVQDDPKLEIAYPFVETEVDLPNLEFELTINDSVGAFSLQAESQSMTVSAQGLPKVVRFKDTNRYFGISAHEFYELDVSRNSMVSITPPLGIPRLSWTTGIAVDTIRDRIVISTLGGEGFLYSYSPVTNDWEVIASLNNKDLADIAYDPDRDLIVGITGRDLLLYLYDSNGLRGETVHALIGELPGIDETGDSPVHFMNIATVDEYAIISVMPSRLERGCSETKQRLYLYDTNQGKGWLTWRN